MSSHYYDWIDSGGSASANSGKMNVYIYPYSQDQKSVCDDGGRIAETLSSRGSRLLDDGAINYYSVNRFESEDNKYPEDDWYGGIDDDDTIEEEFKEFLRYGYNNGTDDNLYSLTGVHLLVHPGSGCNETDGYAPDGAEVEGGLAFEEGIAAWSPICDYNMSLSENAAIQETLHAFMEDPSEHSHVDEHSAGTIVTAGYNRYAVTPMLTYHWDDSDVGSCDSKDSDTPDTHRQRVTSCTVNEIKHSW